MHTKFWIYHFPVKVEKYPRGQVFRFLKGQKIKYICLYLQSNDFRAWRLFFDPSKQCQSSCFLNSSKSSTACVVWGRLFHISTVKKVLSHFLTSLNTKNVQWFCSVARETCMLISSKLHHIWPFMYILPYLHQNKLVCGNVRHYF